MSGGKGVPLVNYIGSNCTTNIVNRNTSPLAPPPIWNPPSYVNPKHMVESTLDLSLPYVTAQTPGVGGQMRVRPEHFVVEEVALYAPQDEGQHLYVNLTKVGLTTKDVQKRLERLFDLRYGDVGYAGLKDKQARTTQTFSIDFGQRRAALIDEAVDRITAELPVTVNWAKRHANKLKPGHLLGNRFRITITELSLPPAEVQQRATTICQHVITHGLPNFFGVQRLGKDGGNVADGLAILLGGKKVKDHWLRRFLISSYQSYLCNRYLVKRLAIGAFDCLLAGDVAKKYETGGMFDVADATVEQPRYAAQQISFTAPLYGPKMWAAQAQAGALEAEILGEAGVGLDHFQTARVDGSRRLGRLLVPDLRCALMAEGLVVEFFLPKGAFATTVIRELMKVDLAETPEYDGEDGS